MQITMPQAAVSDAALKLPEAMETSPPDNNKFSAHNTVAHRGLQREITGESYMLMHPVYTKE
jgi:hypothetical protein